MLLLFFYKVIFEHWNTRFLTIHIHRYFSGRFVSHADRKVQDSFGLDAFFKVLSIGLERGNVTLSTTIFYSFCRLMQRPTACADCLLSQLPLSTCEDNCPFSLKATSIYLENSELNFPPIEERCIFYQGENLKFVGTKKYTCLISLVHEFKTRLNCG